MYLPMYRTSAEHEWRREALIAACDLGERDADPVDIDYAAADAGANFVISHIVEPLVKSLEGVDGLPEAAQRALKNAKDII